MQLEVVKTSAGSDGDAHGPFSSPKSSDEGGVISILNGEHERQVGEPVLQDGEPSTSISDDRVITSISSLGESDEAVTESRRPKSKTRRKTERKRKARAEKRQSVVSDTCSASSSTAVLATFPGDVCEAELHIGPINGTSTSSPSHADGGGVHTSIDLHSRGGDLVFHVKMETSGDRGGESNLPSKTRSHTHTPNQFNLQTQALADALVGFEHKTKCLKTRAGEWSYPLFSNWFYTNKQEETSVTAIESFRQAMPSLVDHCGSLIIDEVVTEECREDSLSLEAALQHHTKDEFSAVVMRATFPGAINIFDGVTDALELVTITPHQTQRHESWRNHSIRINRSTFSDSAVECQFIGPVADTSAGGCIESGDKISFFTRGKMEPSVLEARATEGELTGADPAKATQEENGEKSSSRESDPDDAALGEDDKNITRTRKRESFESTLKLHRTFNNHSLKQRIFIDEPDDRPGAFPAIQDRDGENIDPQPPPQSDKITIGEG